MAETLVDSNVLLDLFTNDPEWAPWSEARLAEAFDAGKVVINPIVYAEISVAFERIETLDRAVPDAVGREPLPREAAFLAGKCFLAIAAAVGPSDPRCTDFYIGAHAAVHGPGAPHTRRGAATAPRSRASD